MTVEREVFGNVHGFYSQRLEPLNPSTAISPFPPTMGRGEFVSSLSARFPADHLRGVHGGGVVLFVQAYD